MQFGYDGWPDLMAPEELSAHIDEYNSRMVRERVAKLFRDLMSPAPDVSSEYVAQDKGKRVKGKQ
ncbi:MAG: hypothetical protein HY847_09770 [Betaproteobacteria bacterium]|nr:hypothetical protein [Betaproteobacteria bacterium]